MRQLTVKQKRLVEENLGLVGTHVRRLVPARNSPRRDREWDDLFQEGCLGLARAASSFDESKGVPFAAYALRRIQSAVSRALPRAFATVRLPDDARSVDGRVPTVVSLEGDPATRDGVERHHPLNGGGGTSIGERIHEKFAAAVDHAVVEVQAGRGENRSAMVNALAQGRLLVPNEEHRVGLRQIVRDTDSTYAKVVWTEKRLTELVRARLSADAELAELCAEAKRRPEGTSAELDSSSEARMSAAMSGRFDRMLHSSGTERRAFLLVRLIDRCGLKLEEVAGRMLSGLDLERKADFLREACSIPEGQMIA